MRAAWLSWLVGLALLAAVVMTALHLSEAEAFAQLAGRVRPEWLAAALALQAGTYLAQAQIWRAVTGVANLKLPMGAAYRLSLVKLLVDQALPSSGLSGAVVVAGALHRRGIPETVTTAAIVVSASAYLFAYAIALCTALTFMAASGGSSSALVIAGSLLFIVTATGVAATVIRACGAPPQWAQAASRHAGWLRRSLELLHRADPRLARNSRLLAYATAMQLGIVILDCLTMWALIRSLGSTAPLIAVFTSFMISMVLRTISVVPGGLGTFEAVSIFTLHRLGVDLPVATSATLLFRGLSFWLPMIPASLLSRGVLRSSQISSTNASPAGPHWSRDAAAVFADLGSGRRGLASNEAARRLHLYGVNAVEDQSRTVALRLFARQFQSPLVLILVFGGIISLFLLEWVDASIILAIVLGSAVLGFSQEYRANAAVSALRRRLALDVRVLRDGVEVDVPATTIVPGDVVVLSAGNLVPGDGIVIDARDFLVSEASLTGESFPVEKRPGVLPADTSLARRTNCVFSGTSVRSGTATVLVVLTGRGTAFGAIAAQIGARPPETDFDRGLRHFGQFLMRTMTLIVLLVIAANQMLGRPTIESLLFAVALAVGLTPELLPAIVSVILSRGAREMAARGVIVRRLEAIENLGSMDVLCTDKTGTLTEGMIKLEGAVDPQGKGSEWVQRLAFLNAVLETGIANPLDAAIVEAGRSRKMSEAGVNKIDEIPYDFTRKRLTIVIEEKEGAGHLIITKGAFTNVLAVCSIEPGLRQQCQSYYEKVSGEGFRVLALAIRRTAPQAHYAHEDEQAMTLAGFLLFLDPPKPGVGATLHELALLGIRTKVISGDNRYIAAHIARQIGLDPHAMLTGDKLSRLKDEALWSLAPRIDLFVEVDPQQKERIVRALQRTGHAVGYLGDGINDAPALHAADVGISVDSAVDVARESADIVLLARDLAVLKRGIEDGRATFANTLKYISITMSANFGNMVSMAVATPLLPFLPLAAKQILLNNFVSDLPSMALSADRVDPEHLARAQRWNLAEVRRFMIVFGLLSTTFDLLTFVLLFHVFKADKATFQTAWFVVSLLTELAVLLVLRTRGPAWKSTPGALLLWTTLAAAVAAVALPYVGPAAALFDFIPLPWPLLAMVVAVVVAYLVTTEIAKRLFFSRGDAGGGRRPAHDA